MSTRSASYFRSQVSRSSSSATGQTPQVQVAAAKRHLSPLPPGYRPPLPRARPVASGARTIPPSSTFLLLFSLLVVSRIFSLPIPSSRPKQSSPTSSKDFDWRDDDDGQYSTRTRTQSKRISLVAMNPFRFLWSTPTPSPVVEEKEEKPRHVYRPNGLMELVPDGPHPVYELIQISEKKWKDKLNRSSKTFKDAVGEYRRRYNRMPPKGFDKWWGYVVQHNVQLPDEYDQIYHDLEPFWGMSPAFVQQQQRLWEKGDEVGSYTLANENHQVFLSGHTMGPDEEELGFARIAEQLHLLGEVQEWLPDFRATFTAHDGPSQFVGYDLRLEAVEYASMSEHMDTGSIVDVHDDRRGWAYACPLTSPLRDHNFNVTFESSQAWEEPKTFIYDHKSSMDPCQHVSHVHLNGLLSGYDEGPVPRKTMVPAFSMCSTQLHSDILTVAMEMWTEDVGDDPEWKDKKHDKLLWRGRNTGTWFFDDGKWKDSQRVRLVRTANQLDGKVFILNSTSSPTESVGLPHTVPLHLLNEEMMDVGFSDEAIQCEYEICEEVENTLTYQDLMSVEEANNWKYIIDVDGNGWSARFKRLMTSNSLIFKSTIFPEWYTDRIQPWVHYIPIKNDFTDLYDVLTFFHGDMDGQNSHDDLAERIARQGKEWSLSFWRKEDMVAYMFRLFLEYARVMSRDREAATFNWEDAKDLI